jgi:hypothetical protein
MKVIPWLAGLALCAFVVGCEPDQPDAKDKDKDKDKVIKENRAKIEDKDDQEDVDVQDVCAVRKDSRLGSMGVPLKVTLKDKEGKKHEVWLCCKECQAKAEAEPDKTIARAADLTRQGNLGKLSKEDRALAEAQGYCAVNDDDLLGSMGVPQKVVLKDKDGKERPVFLCCAGCKKSALADPVATLAKVEELKAKVKKEKEEKKDAPKN